MVVGVIAGLRDLSDDELSQLALAVATELSRRESEVPAVPPPVAGSATAEPAVEPPTSAEPEAAAFTTQYGRVWHRSLGCRHLHSRRTFSHMVPPTNMRLCKTCAQAGEQA